MKTCALWSQVLQAQVGLGLPVSSGNISAFARIKTLKVGYQAL